MDMHIHHLTHADLTVFRDMMHLFGDAFEDPVSYCGAPPDDAYVTNLLRRDTFIALAAMQGERVIGGLAAYELVKFEQARSEVYIYDLAVDAAFRRQKVATQLIEHLKPIARARGAWVIYVQADLTDPSAITLYESLGAREDVLHFDIAPDA